MTTFEDLGLCDELLDTVEDEGYTEPTPVQAQTIPAALDGRDVLGVAQTGTGKTAAFTLPILHHLSAEGFHTNFSFWRTLAQEKASQGVLGVVTSDWKSGAGRR